MKEARLAPESKRDTLPFPHYKRDMSHSSVTL
jgi:hypothetical protein